MKLKFKALIVALSLASIALTTGCATAIPLGLLNTMITTPVTVGNGKNYRFIKKHLYVCKKRYE